jgi:hypothetical protein
MKIHDGTGSGFEARVDSTNRLLTEAVIETEQLEAAVKGDSYQIGSGAVTLTSANESAVLYFKNNEEKDVIITAVNITSSKQTGSSAGVFLAKLYTGGTGLSAGTSQTALNNNFGSSKTLTADITAGQEAATVTSGTASGAFYIQEAVFFNTSTAWVVPKGSTIAVTVTPGASNTSVTVTVTLEAHISRETL